MLGTSCPHNITISSGSSQMVNVNVEYFITGTRILLQNVFITEHHIGSVIWHSVIKDYDMGRRW